MNFLRVGFMIVSDGIKANTVPSFQQMKRLIIIRHAKSDWGDPSLDDFDRPLNKRGLRDAPEMGKRLTHAGVQPDAFVASPALRAITTGKTIASEIGFSPEKILTVRDIYEAGLHELFKVLRSFKPDWECVIMVGHNPGFSDLANVLANESIGHLPTCGVAYLDINVEDWAQIAPGTGALVEFDYPKNKR